MAEPTQICLDCQNPKNLDEFVTFEKGKAHKRKHCHECRKKRRRAEWKKYDQKRNQVRREQWRNDPEFRERSRLACIKYHQKHKERLSEKQRQKRADLRARLLNLYGGCCKCCGETEQAFLCFDHVNGGGTKERKELGPAEIYRKLDKAGIVLPEYRILCHNCNMAIAIFGRCPHQEKICEKAAGNHCEVQSCI